MQYEIMASEPKPKRTKITIKERGLTKLVFVRVV